ncbi:MAG: DUF2569 family protein [Flavobacteriales bacterium]|nr:DUF2569 family protein [Flavobacteriales bacterium]
MLGKRPWSIGSFLILPAIGLCINPLRILYDRLANQGAFFHATDYTSLVATEHPVWIDLAMHLSQLMGFVQLSFTILLVVLYFQHRTSVPLLMKVLYIGTLAWICVDFWICEAMDLEEALGEALRFQGDHPLVHCRRHLGTGVPPERAGPVLPLTRQLDPLAAVIMAPPVQESDSPPPFMPS